MEPVSGISACADDQAGLIGSAFLEDEGSRNGVDTITRKCAKHEKALWLVREYEESVSCTRKGGISIPTEIFWNSGTMRLALRFPLLSRRS